MDNLIYHYTGAEPLRNIILSQTFWITKSDYLNDTTEQSFVTHLLTQFFKEHTTMSRKVQNYISGKLTEYLTHYNHYILSFSQSGDSLPLWNYYSENEGYSIGIDKEEFLSKLLSYFTGIDNEAKVVIAPVEYVRQNQDQRVIKEHLLPYIFFSDDDVTSKRNQLDDVALKLAHMSYTLKHDAYASEQEERIVVICEKTSPVAQSEEFRVLRGSFIPYIVFNRNGDDKFKIPIKKIRLSPYHTLDVTQKSVLYLASRKYSDLVDVDISKSTIPSRY